MRCDEECCTIAAAHSGTELQCIGDRAHVVTYDFQGDSTDEISDAKIQISPRPAMDRYCTPNGLSAQKEICVGANTKDCLEAARSIPINSAFDCQNCFVGAVTDLYYDLDFSGSGLKSVEVGLKNTHIRGALELRGHASGSRPLVSGSIPLISADQSFTINFMIAHIIPIRIDVSMPTTIDYALGVDAALDVTAGGDFDISIGDHFVKWQKGTGFAVKKTNHATLGVTPVLRLNKGEARATFQVAVKSNIQVELDKVMWYRLSIQPNLPLELKADVKQQNLCLSADADLPVSHEADIHFSLFGKDHDLYHFGPRDLFHFHKDQILHRCVGFLSTMGNETVVV